MAKLPAAEANRRFYAEFATTYGRTEDCVVSPRLRERLRAALVRAMAELPSNPRALDACGGSGNASLMLLELGAHPTTVDVSPEMLQIYEAEAHARGFQPRTRVAEIGEFLAREAGLWDLIVFSSALHHLEDYRRTVELALERLAPGGVLLTIFDPTVTGSLGRRLRQLDYLLHVLVRTPTRVPGVVVRRLRKRPKNSQLIGALAEVHAFSGVDDLALHELFRERKLDGSSTRASMTAASC